MVWCLCCLCVWFVCLWVLGCCVGCGLVSYCGWVLWCGCCVLGMLCCVLLWLVGCWSICWLCWFLLLEFVLLFFFGLVWCCVVVCVGVVCMLLFDSIVVVVMYMYRCLCLCFGYVEMVVFKGFFVYGDMYGVLLRDLFCYVDLVSFYDWLIFYYVYFFFELEICFDDCYFVVWFVCDCWVGCMVDLYFDDCGLLWLVCVVGCVGCECDWLLL